MKVFLNRAQSWVTGNCLPLWILKVFYQTELTISVSQVPKGFRMGHSTDHTWLKASGPRRKSTGPGKLKSWSARQSPVRCFQWGLNGSGNCGKGAVILGSTIASTPQSWWGRFLFPLWHNSETPKETVCDEGLWSAPPIPPICTHWFLWSSCGHHTMRAVIKDVEDTKSSNALTALWYPLESWPVRGRSWGVPDYGVHDCLQCECRVNGTDVSVCVNVTSVDLGFLQFLKEHLCHYPNVMKYGVGLWHCWHLCND